MTPESVWDYPRPPSLIPDRRRVRVEFAGVTVAETTRAIRILETSHPPSFYIPPSDIRMDLLIREEHNSFCEWKGQADYWTLGIAGQISENVAWSYPKPNSKYASIRDHLAFYASRVHACYVGDERVTPQEGNFYGGWITSEIKGPFKGAAGTQGW